MTSLITEAEWQSTVRAGFTAAGWLVYHTFDSRKSAAGFPDLTLLSPAGRLVFAELKTDTGKVTAAQQLWLDRLTAGGHAAYLWRPNDWDKIQEVINGN